MTAQLASEDRMWNEKRPNRKLAAGRACHFEDNFAGTNHILAAPAAAGSPLFPRDGGFGEGRP
jgi:hypothetical protein